MSSSSSSPGQSADAPVDITAKTPTSAQNKFSDILMMSSTTDAPNSANGTKPTESFLPQDSAKPSSVASRQLPPLSKPTSASATYAVDARRGTADSNNNNTNMLALDTPAPPPSEPETAPIGPWTRTHSATQSAVVETTAINQPDQINESTNHPLTPVKTPPSQSLQHIIPSHPQTAVNAKGKIATPPKNNNTHNQDTVLHRVNIGGGGHHRRITKDMGHGMIMLPPLHHHQKYPHQLHHPNGKIPNKMAVKPREFVLGQGIPLVSNPLVSNTSSIPKDSQMKKHQNSGQHATNQGHKQGTTYPEIPHVLDGFLILNRAPAQDPDDVYVVDISGHDLKFVIQDDLSLFSKLHTLRAGENKLPIAKLGGLMGLKRLMVPFNEITDLDLEMEGRFSGLEHLDASFNKLTPPALIVLATLSSLKHLDLTSNEIRTLPTTLMDMSRWRDHVIEYLLPAHVKFLDSALASMQQQQHQQPPQTQTQTMDGALHPEDVNDLPKIDENQDEVKTEPDQDESDADPKLVLGVSAHVMQVDKAEKTDSDTHTTHESDQQEETQTTSQDEVVSHQASGSEPSGDGHESLEKKSLDGGSESVESKTKSTEEEHENSPENTSAIDNKIEEQQQHETEEKKSNDENNENLKPSESQTKDETVINQDDMDRLEREIEDMSLWNSQPIIIAFENLESLSLENNRLHLQESFEILGHLPNLKSLNQNRFTSFAFLASSQPNTALPLQSSNAGLKSLLEPPPKLMIRKYNGFKKLEDLKIAFNRINSSPGLLGIIWLPVLKNVWIEGNPILNKRAPVPNLSSTDDLLPIGTEFDPLEIIPKVYDITICDLIYQSPPPVLEDTFYTMTTLPTGDQTIRRVVRQPKHSKFIGEILKRAPGGLRGGTMSHHVEDVVLRTGDVDVNAARRDFKLTDEEVKETIKAGRILTLKELKKMRRMQGEQIEDEEDKKENESGTQSQSQTTKSETTKSEMSYDPNAIDDTFLTGVHITGGSKLDSTDSGDKGSQNDDFTYTDSEDDDNSSISSSSSFASSRHSSDTMESSEYSAGPFPPELGAAAYRNKNIPITAIQAAYNHREAARNHPLPSNIQASIRALRHALLNPISYWRILEDSYAKPTFASKVRFSETHPHAPVKKQLKSNSMSNKKGSQNSTNTHPESQHQNPTINLNPRPIQSASKSETSTQDAAMLKSGLISPANTMWTNYAMQAEIEREELQKAVEAGRIRSAQIEPVKGQFGEDEAYQVVKGLMDPAAKSKKVGGTGDIPSAAEKEYTGIMVDEKNGKLKRPDSVKKHVTINANGKVRMTTSAAVATAEERIMLYNLKNSKKGNRINAPLRPKDEFEEMHKMMAKVDEQLMVIENNLASVLESEMMSRLVPKSRNMLTEVENEYKRIENMYFISAKKAMQKKK